MARVGEPGVNLVVNADLPAIFTGDNQFQRLHDVLEGVQGLHRSCAGTAALLVFPVGVAFLDVGRIAEHDVQQFPGDTGAEDPAPEALLHQQRQAARMVNMGVGDNDIVDETWYKFQLTVAVIPFIFTLLQAAVNENLAAVAGDAVAAAGDGSRRAVKGQFHRVSSFPAPLL